MSERPSIVGSVAALWIFPIKGCRGVSVDRALVEAGGFAGDRRWMVTDPAGMFLTLRTEPRLSSIRARESGAGWRIEAAEHGGIDLPGEASGEDIRVQVWKDEVLAVEGPGAVSEWMSAALGRDVRVVHVPDERLRTLPPEYASPEDCVSFADGYPYLMTSLGSLEKVNAGLDRPVAMERFRPNLVVDGPAAFEEDSWRSLTIGDVPFEAVKTCERCVVVDQDEDSGGHLGGVLSRLAELQGKGGPVTFGQNLIPRGGGWVSVVDPVRRSR